MQAVVKSAEGINHLIPICFESLKQMILDRPDRLRLIEANCGWHFEARTAVLSWQRFDPIANEWVGPSRLKMDRGRSEEDESECYVVIEISSGGTRFFSSHEQLFGPAVQSWLLSSFGVE